MESQKRIAIFTTFLEPDNAYSLCNVVEDQLRMFIDNGYTIKLIVTKQFVPKGIWSHNQIKLAEIPVVRCSNEGELLDDYKDEANQVHTALNEHLKDVDVVIAHDITLQPAHLIHNLAARRIADKRDDLRWLHWVHSSTAPQVRCNNEEVRQEIFKPFPNSFYVYPNDWTRQIVARNYRVELNEVKTVHHPTDVCGFFNFHPLSKEITKEMKLLEADVICVYPARLDRGKQPEYNIKTLASLKQMGWNVKFICIDFHSTGGDKVVYRDEMKRIAQEWGLVDKEDILWTSEFKEETKHRVPREVVKDLKCLSELTIHPSTSETYSLVVQESMLTKNFCVLNHHFPAMRDIYGSKNVLYEPFGGAVNVLDNDNGATNFQVHDEKVHFDNLARKVRYFLENDWVIAQFRFIRKYRNTDYVFKHELEPLLSYSPLQRIKQ